MIPINKVTSDSACRTFLSNDVSFASFYNAAIFEGKQIIHLERLVRFEFDISFIINDSKRAEDKKRKRDIVVKSDINGIYCLLGIEHQSSIDETMVIRCGIYEMLEFLKQAENKEYKRLVPQIIVVLYIGTKKWNGPLKLSDYFEIPEELKKYFNDWKIILVDVKEMDTSKIKDEQTRYFIEAIQAMYKGSYEDLKRLKFKRLNVRNAHIFIDSNEKIKVIDPRKPYVKNTPYPKDIIKLLLKLKVFDKFLQDLLNYRPDLLDYWIDGYNYVANNYRHVLRY